MSIFTKNDENWSSNDFSKAWSSVIQRVKDVAAAQRQQQKAQQAQQAAPKPSQTYTMTTTKGKQYTFDDDAANWISNRYFRDNADSYGLDDADQYAKRTGQMSASMRKSYKNSTVDQKLAEMGLPSEKNFEKYLGEYNKWHTGGVDQVYGNAVSSEQWAKMGEMYKRDWAYDNTVEDQTRKALGLVPTKLLAEYADTELDESLMARGLPPSASLSKYNDQYNNYKGIDALYKNAAGAITAMRVTPTDDGKYITDDDQRYTIGGQTMTGKQWYAKKFFDELERTDEQGNQVYASLMPLFKNSNGIVGGDAGIDPTGDYANERGKIITSYAKNAGNAADYDSYNAFSYEDFAGKYGDYYDKYFKDIKDDSGQTVGGFLDVKAREADAEREKAFYTVEDKWFDGDKGIDAFVGRYMESYPGNSPEQMFTDMLEHGISEKTVKKAMRALANSAKENRSEDGTSGFYDIKDAYAKAKSNYDAKNKEAKVDDGHTEELDMLYGPNGYDVVDGKVIPKAVEEPDAKAKYNAADKSRKEYVKTALKEAEDDQATIDATANAIQNALSGVTATDVDTVLDVIKSVEKQDFTNPVAVQLALTDLGFIGNLSGFADDLTDGWSQEDKNKLAFYLGGANLTGQTTEDYFYDFNRAEGDSLGDTWADTGYVQDRRKLRRADFAYNLEWAQEQIANGTPAGEVYNVLAGAGYQEEMEAYLPEEWRKAIFTDVTVPRMYEQAGGDNLAAWELMSPAERKATSEKMWNEMSAEEKAKKYQNADWWKYDPDVYRTTGQAFEQQLIAVLPEFINNIATSGVQAVDSIFAGISGRPEMWDTTQDMMKVQQGLAQFGKVYDETNGAAVADMVGTAAGEFLRMYTLGAVGSIAGEAFGATKAGTALANAAKNAGSWGVRKLADIGLSMATTLPFVVSSYAGSYAEAKAQGLSNGDAALYGATMGIIEGVTEGLNVDRVWGKAFGSDKFGKMIADGTKAVLGMNPVTAARLLSIPISGISEVTEELMSYTAETLWKQNINADSWGETPWDFKGFFKEAGLVSFITGAVGAGVSSGSITMESLLTDYALTDSKAFHQVFGQDLCTSIAVAENLPKSALEAYEKGGATMMSQDAYRTNDNQIASCNEGIDNAAKKLDATKAKLKDDYDTELLEIEKQRAKLMGVNTNSSESVQEFVNLCNRLGIKIDFNQPIAAQAAAALDARVKQKTDDYNTAVENAETLFANNKKTLEDQRSSYEKKRQEHFVGLYLANRDGIIAEMPDELIKNVAKTYQEGGKYEPGSVTNQNAPVDGTQAAQYNISAEEAQQNGIQGTEAGNEGAQAGGDAGVSGQAVAVGNQGGQGSGVLGRANPRWIESVSITNKAKANGIDPVDLRTDNNDASSFHSSIGEAKANNTFGAFVDQHSIDEYGNMRTFMSDDGGVGVAVTNDGDIVSVFKNPARNQSKKASTSILFTALENGGKKLDNFNSADLSAIYLQHGFVPVARIRFNDDYAPDGWNYERDGRPDILFWVHNGDSADTILDKMGTYKMPDVESLPLFEGENAYDEAKAYRDGLVTEKAGWPSAKKSYKDYMTKNAIDNARKSDKAKEYKHPELAFAVEASDDNIDIPIEELTKHPTIAKAEAKIKEQGEDTLTQYPGRSDENRNKLRSKIIRTMLDAKHGSAVFENGKIRKVNKKEDFSGPVEKGKHAAIIMGPPAAGKSTVMANPLSNQMHARIIDSDVAKALLPEFDEGWGAGRVNEESGMLAGAVLNRILNPRSKHYGENIVIPKVGGGNGNSILELAQRLQAAGYTVDLYLNNVSAETSATRAMARFAKEGRYLSTGFLQSIGDKPLQNFKRFAQMDDLFNYAEWRDNNVKYGEKSILRWKTGDDRAILSGATGRGEVEQSGQVRTDDAGGRGQGSGALADGGGPLQVDGRDGGVGRRGGSKFDAADNGVRLLSDNERAQVQDLVKQVGYAGTLSFINDPDQYFDGRIQNGNITLNLAYLTSKDAKELKTNPGFWVLKHEWSHFIENTRLYKDYFNAVKGQMMNELGEEGFAKSLEHYKKRAEEAGHPFKSDAEAQRDMVADYASSNLFTSRRAIDSFVREQGGVASRLYNWLQYVIDRGKLRRSGNADAAKVLKAERMYAQAFRKANTRPTTSNDINYSIPGIDYDLVKSRYGLDENGNYVGVANPNTGVTAEEDARYMQLVRDGRLYEAGQMVKALFERNGWWHGYHGASSPVGKYTAIKPSMRPGSSAYFVAQNLDMSQTYANRKRTGPISYGPDRGDFYGDAIDPDTGEVIGGDEEQLLDYVQRINEAYGTAFTISHNFYDKNTGAVLDDDALADAAPKDVASTYVLWDTDTYDGNPVSVQDASSARALARMVQSNYDAYGIVTNPLEADIYNLYVSPENAATHRGYNAEWTRIPNDGEVAPENVYTRVLVHNLPDGRQELVLEKETGETQRFVAEDGESREDLFNRVFGENQYGDNAYEVFERHKKVATIDGEPSFYVNDFYVDNEGRTIDYTDYHHAPTDDIGQRDLSNGYYTTRITNIYDYMNSNPYSERQRPGDVFITRNPNYVKSADAVTYDNKGNVIPLSLRANTEVGDLRFSTPGLSWDEIVQQYGQARAQNEADQKLADAVQEYGTIEQGREPRARDVQVPRQTNDLNRVSQWIRSLVESGKLTDDQAQNVLRMVVEQDYGTYIPTSQAERMEEARAYIAERQPLQAQQEFHDMVMQGKFGVKTNALGIQLLSDASARGDFASVLDIAADLQLAATEAGQSAQIFNVLKELKGVGSAWYMQKVIDRMNSKYADKIKSGKMQRISVDPALMANLAKATTVDQITAAEEAVAKDIARQLPLTWDDRLSSWRYFSMLANPTTHIRNITGNLLMKGLNTAKDITAIGVQRAAEKLGLASESDRAHAWLTSDDKSIWGDWVQQSYEEQARNLSGGSKLGFESFVKQNMRNFDTKWVDALARFNFKLLEGEDIAFIRPAYKNALMQYMKAQDYTLNGKGQAGKVDAKGKFHEITKAQMNEAIDWASQQAWKQTFRDASSLATMLNKLSKENAVSRLLVEGVMPFKKTPINIARRGVDYSPAGIIKGIAQLTNGVKKGKVTTAQAIDTLSSGITGSALMALGVMLAKLGIIRAGGEKDKKLETYLEDTGDQTYAIKFGDKSINMSSIAPATIPLFMGVALNEMIEQSGETIDLSTITDTIAGTLNPFMEMSFMASLNSALKNYNNNGIGGALGNTLLTAAQNYGSQYLPTIGGKVAQFVDPTRRTTKSDATSPVGSNMDYYARSLAKKIPGLETTLQPDVDVWGRTDVKDSFSDWAWDFANKFILPTNVKVTNRDAVDNELIRVVESTGVTDFLPSDGNKYFTVKGEKYTMNARQYAQYSQERGQAAYVAIKELMTSPAYQAASDETKADMLNKAKEAAYKQVSNLWKEKLGAFDK